MRGRVFDPVPDQASLGTTDSYRWLLDWSGAYKYLVVSYLSEMDDLFKPDRKHAKH